MKNLKDIILEKLKVSAKTDVLQVNFIRTTSEIKNQN
jgi:hypothetical protein